MNDTPEVTSFKPLTYSKLLNTTIREKHTKSKYSFLNLEKLSHNFPITQSPDVHQEHGFIGISYYQNKPEFSYNNPPKGPIPEYFECINCESVGPHFHTSDCRRPFESSLVLTAQGAQFYKKKEGTSYKLIVKKRGQAKVISDSIKNQKFTDNVELLYRNKNDTNTIIKIGKNGTINIISANFDEKDLEKDLIKKINQTDALDTSEYGSDTFVVSPETSYVYIIFAQFNLYPKKEDSLNYINLESIDLNLWHTPLFKRKKGSDIFFHNEVGDYTVTGYRYNSGNITSRNNKTTNPFIQFTLTNDSIFKVSVMVYKKGGVQLRLSYQKENKDSINYTDNPIELSKLKEVYSFLKVLFTDLIVNSNERGYPIILSEAVKIKKGIPNTVDGDEPQVCHNHKGYEVRPVEFSFYGQCPIPGYYVRPEGKKRRDGKFEPCCYKLKKSGKDSISERNKRIREGYSVTPGTDNLSAVYTPGTKIVESRNFKGLKDFTESELMDCIESNGHLGESGLFKDSKKNTGMISSQDYSSFRKKVLGDYYEMVQTKKMLFQYFTPLNQNNLSKLTESNFMIFPIYADTIRVFLYFNEVGESFFININKDVSESGIHTLPKLENTIIDGYLYPFKGDDFIFYPIDILAYYGNSMRSEYISRFNTLTFCVDLINENTESLNVSIEFVDSMDEIKNYIVPSISGILFINHTSEYTDDEINKKIFIWTRPLLQVSFEVKNVNKNRWEITIGKKNIPQKLLPQNKNSVELPIAFTKGKISDGNIILFNINLNTNGTININKPLVPVEKIPEHINDYPDVINILESINSPITADQLLS